MASLNKIALVAKPWRGGLGTYVAMALEEIFPGRVQRLNTYPVGATEKFEYRLDRSAWRRRLVERIQSLDADVVIFLNLLPEFASLSARPGNVAWLTDSPEPALGFLAPFARVFVSDPGYAEMVQGVVGEDRYAGVLPFACQPSVHQRVERSDKAAGFCFIANRDPRRDCLLRHLYQHNKVVHVYGNYFLRHPLAWRHPSMFHPSVGIGAMGAVYARYLASLNVHAEVVRGGTNMRTFECAAYGIPQLIEYKPGLENMFDLDRDVYVFRDERDIIESMQALEADVGGARRRAARAHERAMQEHTYSHRVERILQRL